MICCHGPQSSQTIAISRKLKTRNKNHHACPKTAIEGCLFSTRYRQWTIYFGVPDIASGAWPEGRAPLHLSYTSLLHLHRSRILSFISDIFEHIYTRMSRPDLLCMYRLVQTDNHPCHPNILTQFHSQMPRS